MASYFRCGVCTTNPGTGVRTCTYVATTRQVFYPQCPKISLLCSEIRGAYVPAITVCNQALFTGTEDPLV